jgi:hypothetical protein
MRFDSQKVLAKARQAHTDELLDQATVLSEQMEPEAINIFNAELARRGVGPDEILEHERRLKHRVVRRPDGTAASCSFCVRAAVESRLDWHRLGGLIPLFRRRFYYCEGHWSQGEKAAPNR